MFVVGWQQRPGSTSTIISTPPGISPPPHILQRQLIRISSGPRIPIQQGLAFSAGRHPHVRDRGQQRPCIPVRARQSPGTSPRCPHPPGQRLPQRHGPRMTGPQRPRLLGRRRPKDVRRRIHQVTAVYQYAIWSAPWNVTTGLLYLRQLIRYLRPRILLQRDLAFSAGRHPHVRGGGHQQTSVYQYELGTATFPITILRRPSLPALYSAVILDGRRSP